LRELTPVEASPDELAARLSMTGLAVDQILKTGEGISGVVVGKVLEIKELEGAKSDVILVTVDGGGGPTQVICGARNFKTGDLVPYAVPGSTLPDGREIGAKEIPSLGVTSNGMLCSARELGLSDDHKGIFVLDGDLKVGEDLRVALGLDDVVLELDVMPNRPDCLSMVGIAREVAAIYDLPLHEPAFDLREEGDPADKLASVVIRDAAGCPRYSARIVVGVNAKASSPWWMARRLLACGMRPISAVVDVTNYVMLERGQPLHGFDLPSLGERSVVVRKPTKGEKTLTTLDGVSRALERDDLLICDASRPVAFAGIMGGAETEVTDATTEVLIESAHFEEIRILRTARRLGLRTEASVRFERGTDPEGTLRAADRAASLIAQIAGGTVARGVIDEYPRRWKPKPVRLAIARANELIGIHSTADEMAGALRVLGCEVTASSRTSLRVVPPSWRPDLKIEEDLVEEVARIYGFDRIPATLPSGSRSGGLSREQALRRAARRALLGAGLSEAQTLSLISPATLELLSLPDSHPWRNVLALANPLSEDESVLRPSLIPGLLTAARYNVSHRNTSIALFEIGVRFTPSQAELPVETLECAWVMTGPTPETWHAQRTYDFFDAKGVLESIGDAIGVREWSVAPSEQNLPFHPARCADVIVAGEKVGVVAELHPRAAAALDLPGRVAIGSVELAALFEAAVEVAPGDVGRFPPAERDLAIVLPETIPAAEVEKLIRDAAGALLERVALFDVFRGAQAGEGNVSLAWTLTFRDPDRTLTDEEIDAAVASIEQAVTGRGWSLRR
jgi:phenylalanyl-tRNA synthetase beta chain